MSEFHTCPSHSIRHPCWRGGESKPCGGPHGGATEVLWDRVHNRPLISQLLSIAAPTSRFVHALIVAHSCGLFSYTHWPSIQMPAKHGQKGGGHYTTTTHVSPTFRLRCIVTDTIVDSRPVLAAQKYSIEANAAPLTFVCGSMLWVKISDFKEAPLQTRKNLSLIMHDRSTQLYLFCDKKQTQVSDINSSEKWP